MATLPPPRRNLSQHARLKAEQNRKTKKYTKSKMTIPSAKITKIKPKKVITNVDMDKLPARQRTSPDFEKMIARTPNLTDREKEALFMHFVEGLKYEAIGIRFQSTHGAKTSRENVHQLVSKAIQKVGRQFIQPDMERFLRNHKGDVVTSRQLAAQIDRVDYPVIKIEIMKLVQTGKISRLGVGKGKKMTYRIN